MRPNIEIYKERIITMKYALAFLLSVVIICDAFAQGRPIGVAGINYSMGLTTQETNDFINEFSWRGFGLEYKKFLNMRLSLGFNTGWNIFTEKRTDPIILENGTIRGTQIRFINSFPILVTAHLHFRKPRSGFRPFVGLGIGTYYILQRLEIGVIKLEEDNWHFGLTPELGILIPTKSVFIIISAKYNYAFAASKSIQKEPIDITYLSLNISVLLPVF
jgi:outer membrane protein W